MHPSSRNLHRPLRASAAEACWHDRRSNGLPFLGQLEQAEADVALLKSVACLSGTDLGVLGASKVNRVINYEVCDEEMPLMAVLIGMLR